MKNWFITTALEQIEKCGFECEGGLLPNNEAWQWLVAAAKVGPEFWPGQVVFCEVKVEAAGVKLSKWANYFVVGCHMESDSRGRFWTYDLSNDPPGPWHYGTVHHSGVRGDKLRLEIPASDAAGGAG